MKQQEFYLPAFSRLLTLASNSKMTPQAFNSSWEKAEAPLSPISPARLAPFGLRKATFDFLAIAGLPADAAPDLSFSADSDDPVFGMNRLTARYDFGEDREPYERYIVIGSCRDGDLIAIDTGDNDQIVALDHEDLFRPAYFNGSLAALADFLIFFRDFEKEVLKDKDPDDHRQYYNFTDRQFVAITTKMQSLDSRAVTEKGFWKDELEIMRSLRQDYRFKT